MVLIVYIIKCSSASQRKVLLQINTTIPDFLMLFNLQNNEGTEIFSFVMSSVAA